MRWYALASLLLLLPYAPARALVPDPPPMPCMLYFLSDAVFIGQVTAVHEVHATEDNEDFLEGWDFTLNVIKSYRGTTGSTIQVHSENDSGRLNLEVGKQYLLFASNREGKLTIGYDMLSGELKDSKQTLRDLDKVAAHKPDVGGDVFGRVTLIAYGSHSGGVGGVHVNIEGSAGAAKAVTNANGWFKVHLPAGAYAAKASDPKWTFKPLDITWQNSNSFTVPDGGCAEIQIEADPVK